MRRFRRWLWWLIYLVVLLSAAVVIVLQSPWLRVRIHQRVIAELEKATGGRVTLDAFDWDWAAGEAGVRGLVIRGREPQSAEPLIRIPAAKMKLTVLAYLSPNVDLRELKVTRPEFHLITFPDGSTNWPGLRAVRQSKPFLEQFIRLAIDRFEVDEGLLTWNLEKYPFSIRGEKLDLNFRLEGAGQDARYRGFLASRKLRLAGWRFEDAAFDLDTEVWIERDRVRFANGRLARGNSVVQAAGELLPVTPDWRELRLTSDFSLAGAMSDLVPLIQAPVQAVGTFEAKGRVEWEKNVIVTADASATGWAIDAGGQRFQQIAWKAPVRYEEGRVTTSRLAMKWLNGEYRGRATTDFDTYEVSGTASNFRLRDLAPLLRMQAPPADATVIGPVKVTGRGADFTALARVTLLANQPERPFTGSLNFEYLARTRTLKLDPSYVDYAGTRVDLNGDMARGMRASVTTRDLATLPFAQKIPIQLAEGGEVSFEGLVTGALDSPRLQGDLDITKFRYGARVFDGVSATVDAGPQGVTFQGLQAEFAGAEIAGEGSVTLKDWAFTDASPYQAKLDVKGADVARVLREAGVKLDASGTATATLEVNGTGDRLRVKGPVEIASAVVSGQPLGRVTAQTDYDGARTKLTNATASIGGRAVKLDGEYHNDGAFAVTVSGDDIALDAIPAFAKSQPDVTGRASAHLTLAGRYANDRVQWSRIEGDAAARSLVWKKQALGDLTAAMQSGGRLNVIGNLRGAALTGSGTVGYTSGLPVAMTFALAPLAFARLEDLLPASEDGKPATLPFEGGVTLSGTLNGPLEEPAKWKGTLRGEQLTLAAKDASPAIKRDLSIRNTGPLEVDFDERGLNFRQVKLEAKETSLQASGLLGWAEKTAWNLRVIGQVNLGVLSSFQPDLIANGVSNLDATIRGTRQAPQLNGRLVFTNASFFLRDVANGLENVAGRIVFDKDRARVETLTAESGGGRIAVGGYLSFGSDLGYQLQGRVDNVRVRYPTGVSTAVNASLSLTGSRARSLLSGAVTIARANIAPQTDLGALLTETQKNSTPARIENEFLREMQFDIRVDTAQDAELTTSLTQNVQAEINLRVRGTPARPVVLGRLAFTQGEINFFGSKYIIDRGEVNFYNPTKIEPVINFDLQTRVRGVVVTLTFAGPASKINLAYRSDPPLQPAEIIALLAVGRTPASGIVGGGSSVQNPGILSGSATALLGQAATTPLTGRLQRLFGLRSLRIDPQLTGLENTAQARLTLEQQVSRDVTVTFITNLNRTQQQIVSVEWDFSREFSAIAVRDENGVFGLDFFYRKRFK